MIRPLALTLVALVATLAAGCDKKDPSTEATSGAAAEASDRSPVTAKSASAPLLADSTIPAAPTSAGPPSPAASGADAAACGGKENPCPLQGWMRENVNPPMNKKDLPALAEALDKIAMMAPPGYTNWASISKDGAAAARNSDENAAKASCRGCHDQYKQKYKTEMRGRKVPGT